MTRWLQRVRFLWQCAAKWNNLLVCDFFIILIYLYTTHVSYPIMYFNQWFMRTKIYLNIPNNVQLPQTLKSSRLRLVLFHPLNAVSTLDARSTNKLRLENVLEDQRQKTICHWTNSSTNKPNTVDKIWKNQNYKTVNYLFKIIVLTLIHLSSNHVTVLMAQ